jgi:hypothetical protein
VADAHAEAWSFPDSLDALVAAPESHRLLFENNVARVLETLIRPGERTQVHTHRWPSVLYVLSFADFVRRDAEGMVVLVDTRDSNVPRPQPGTVLWSAALPPHTLENVGLSEIRMISVELKRG